jgi:hypothetical protein
MCMAGGGLSGLFAHAFHLSLLHACKKTKKLMSFLHVSSLKIFKKIYKS